MLDQLSEKTRIPKQILLREAVDDLLEKHGAVPGPTNAGLAIMILRAAMQYAAAAEKELNREVWTTRTRYLLANGGFTVDRLDAYIKGHSRIKSD